MFQRFLTKILENSLSVFFGLVTVFGILSATYIANFDEWPWQTLIGQALFVLLTPTVLILLAWLFKKNRKDTDFQVVRLLPNIIHPVESIRQRNLRKKKLQYVAPEAIRQLLDQSKFTRRLHSIAHHVRDTMASGIYSKEALEICLKMILSQASRIFSTSTGTDCECSIRAYTPHPSDKNLMGKTHYISMYRKEDMPDPEDLKIGQDVDANQFSTLEYLIENEKKSEGRRCIVSDIQTDFRDGRYKHPVLENAREGLVWVDGSNDEAGYYENWKFKAKSLMVVPIRYWSEVYQKNPVSDGPRCIGFLTINSKEKGAFYESHDVDLAGFVADLIYLLMDATEDQAAKKKHEIRGN